MMILYHGSAEIVRNPVFGKGKKYNDYGQGFYCTESAELAKEWACPIHRDGFANRYVLNTDGLRILNLNTPRYHILNWLALLLQNRKFDLSKNMQVGLLGKQYILDHFLPDTAGYDIIIGYRADDRYFAFAKDFLQNGISVRQLAESMKLGELGEQVVLMSPKAFESIRFDSYEIADSNIYFYRRLDRDSRANRAFDEIHSSAELITSDLYLLDILREEIRNDDQRLR